MIKDVSRTDRYLKVVDVVSFASLPMALGLILNRLIICEFNAESVRTHY